jgi:hypothetical protein
MKYPGFLAVIQIKYHFVYYAERTHLQAYKSSQHFIVVAGNIVGFCAIPDPFQKMLDNFHVTSRPVSFAELPNVNYIAVEHNYAGFDAFQIMEKLFGMTPIGAKVNVRNYDHFNLPLFFLHQVNQFLRMVENPGISENIACDLIFSTTLLI